MFVKRSGFTLIELMLTVAIIGILSAVGWAMVDDLLPRYRARRAALEFASWCDQSRLMSVVNGREYRICMMAADPSITTATDNIGLYYVQAGNKSKKSTLWDTLPIDGDTNGTPPTDSMSDVATSEGKVEISKGGEDQLADVSIDYDSFDGPSHGSGALSNADCIVFSPRGWVTNPDSAFLDSGYISVDFVNKMAAIEGRTELYRVKVARSGFARVDYTTVGFFGDVDGRSLGLDDYSTTAGTASSSSGG